MKGSYTTARFTEQKRQETCVRVRLFRLKKWITDEFHNYLLTAIESSDSPLKEKLIEYAKLFYAPHTTTPYEVAHPNNFSFKHLEEAELSQQLYDFVCKAAEATGCRVK